MAVGKKKAIRDFTQGNPTKELLMFSLPIACTLILQSFYNMADTLIIGNFVGDTAIECAPDAGIWPVDRNGCRCFPVYRGKRL